MENESTESTESSETNAEQSSSDSSSVKPQNSPLRLVVMGVLLSAMVVMALVQSGARRDRDEASAKADAMEDFASPLDYMKALGKTPRVKTEAGSITQVYRWQGVLQHFELRVKFLGSDGSYTAEGTESSSISRFKGKEYAQLKLAKKTGTEYEEFPKEKSPKEEGGGAMKDGPGAGKEPPGPRPGDGPSGPGTPGATKGNESRKARALAYFSELELDEEQKNKVDAIIDEQIAQTQSLFRGPREGMREKFTALRAKYDAQFKEVLNAEQFETYKKARDAARSQWGGGKGKGGRPGPPSDRPRNPPERP